MHYGSKAFSVNGLSTIVPKQAGVGIQFIYEELTLDSLKFIYMLRLHILQSSSRQVSPPPLSPSPPFSLGRAGFANNWPYSPSFFILLGKGEGDGRVHSDMFP